MDYNKVPRNAAYSTNWFTYFCGMSANLLLVSSGAIMVWTSPVLPKLLSNNTEINPLGTPITTTEISIIASSPFFSATASYILMAKISDKIGRKTMIVYISMCNVIILVALAFTTNIYIYYLCLILVGCVYAGSFVNIPIYNIEISEDRNRGKMGCLVGLSIPLGMLFGYIFGPMTTVKGITLICAIPPAINLLLWPFLIESPIYLVSIGKMTEAIKCLKLLRRNTNINTIEIEFQKIKDNINTSKKIHNANICELFRSKAARKGLYLSLVICVTQQMSGVSVILAFMAPIFSESGSTLSGDTVGLIVGSIKVCFYLLAACFIERLGRRQLLLVSSLGCGISMLSLGSYFYLKNINSPIIADIRWFPILAAICFIISFGLGLGPIPIAIVGELFVTELRASGVGTVLAINNLILSTVLFSFPLLTEAYGN